MITERIGLGSGIQSILVGLPPDRNAMNAAMPVPLVSVILVCRNPGPSLREALNSAWNQPDTDHEVVLIDGASTDGTREWLESQRLRFGTLVSEPDNGVYDAMNKGVATARGDWVLFLGSDDRLAGSQVLAGISLVLNQATADVVVGEAVYDDGRAYSLGADSAAVRRNFVHHQAAFYRRSLFAAHGNFSGALRIMADYDFNLRLLKAGVHFKSIPVRIATCGSGGLSDAGGWNGYREEITVRHRHFPAWQCWPWDAGSLLRFLRKKILRTFSAYG